MYKKLLPLAIVLLLLPNLSSCIDRDLCYYRDHAHTGLIKPVFKWTEEEWSLNEIPEEMSFLLVGDDGAVYQHDTIGVYKVLTGNYNLISYNKSGIQAGFRYDKEINTIEAYTEVLGGLTSEPGVIFRDITSCSVTPDDTTIVNLEPLAVVKGINLTVNVEGLDKPSHIANINCFLGGCATAINLSTFTRNKVPATIPFSMKRESSGGTTFVARTTTFGPVVEEGNTLILDLNLYTGGTVTFPLDLSEYWKTAEAEHLNVINCIVTIRIKKLGINTGDTEGDINIDEWGPGSWDTLL